MSSSKAYIQKMGDGFVVGNRYLAREVRCGRTVATAALVNRLTRRRFPVISREFTIQVDGIGHLLTASDFHLHGTPRIRTLGTRQILEICLKNRDYGLSVVLRYEVAPNDFYMRKHLVICGGKRLIRDVSVESFDFLCNRYTLGGFGQPIFLDDELFLGLEYPAGYNIFQGRAMQLTHHPGRTGDVVCKPAVWGVCPNTINHRVRDGFLRYIEENRARPVQRLHTQYCGVRSSSLESWLDTAKRVFADQGLKIDSLYIGHSRTLYDPKSLTRLLPAGRQSPNLAQLRRMAMKKLGAGLGFHMNTGGGRSSGDHAWFRKHFDMISPIYYCLADPRVKEGLQRNLLELIKRYDAECFAFDWMWWKTAWECPHAGHRGHIPGVKYSREAITDAFIDMTAAWRKAKPDIILEDLEVEHSPWWLFHVDALWSYAGEGKCPIPLIDGSMRGWQKTNIFPMNSVWYAINPPSGSGGFMGIGERSLREFTDNVILQYLRGSQIDEIYYNLASFTPEEQRLYTEIMRWGHRNQKILLANTTFILGDPAQDEPYGFTHFLKDNRGIIGVYNPCPWQTRTVCLRFDESSHFYQEGRVVKAEVVYPYRENAGDGFGYGDSLNLCIPGQSLVVIKTTPQQKRKRRRIAPNIQGPNPKFDLVIRKRRVLCRGSKNRVLNVTFGITIPERERIMLVVLADTPFNADVLLADKALRDEYDSVQKQLHQNLTKVRQWTPMQASEGQLYAETAVLNKEIIGTIDCRVLNNNRLLPTRWIENVRQQVTGIGPHPYRQRRMHAFCRHSTEVPLTSGSVELRLEARSPLTRWFAWLEVDNPLPQPGPNDQRCRTPLGELPCDWHNTPRRVINILKGQ